MKWTSTEVMNHCRTWLKSGDLPSLQAFYETYLTATDGLIDEADVWRILFTNACIYGQLAIAQWLYQLYQVAPLGMRLGLRPTFHYCHSLVKKDAILSEWLRTILST